MKKLFLIIALLFISIASVNAQTMRSPTFNDSSGYLVPVIPGEGLKISGLGAFKGLTLGQTSQSSNYSITTNDHYIDCTGGSSGITVTLPTAVGNRGLTYSITKVDNGVGTVTIATTSSQTINGSPNYIITYQYVSYTVHSNGSNWIIN